MADLFANLRPASFRGVPFQVTGSKIDGIGRRLQVHEYPQRDKPYVQEFGRGTREISFPAFVAGEDYIAKANAVLNALEAFGPGTLVHPEFGSITVSVKNDCSVEFKNAVGYAEFSLSFVESGELEFPSSADSTAALSRTAAGGLQSASTDFFAKAFATAGFISDVADKATRAYGTVLNFVANPTFALASLTGWNNLPGNIASLTALFGNPLALGSAFAGLLDLSGKAAASGITGSNPVALPVIRGLTRMAVDPALANPAEQPGPIQSAIQITANDRAIRTHTRQLLLVQAVNLTSYLDAVVYDDTTALKNELAAALDAETLTANNDDVYQALMSARTAMWQDLTERSRGSARIVTLTPRAVLPALVLAYDHHGDAGRADEIVARNRVRNPGFVPAAAVKVLSR